MEESPAQAIPFNRATTLGKELDYMALAVANGSFAGDQAFARRCQTFIESVLGVPRVLLTTSCTHALEMAALLLDIKNGDEVIVPSFTFVSTASAFALRGATPVFADVRSDTLNLDEKKLAPLISPRTKAIVPVHYAGVSCEMDEVLATASRHGIPVIEDNAHGLFGKYKGRYLGTLGTLASQSFHETKNITCGEGGALLINDPALIPRAEIIRDKGTNRARFFRGQVDKYSWVDLGSSYVVSDLLAAFLLGQLEQWQRIQQRRRAIWHYYHDSLAHWAPAHGIRLPIVPPHCEQTYHMFYVLLPSLELRQALIQHFKAHKINAVFHYLPLHLSEMGRTLGGKPGSCPIAENVSDRLLRLPFYVDMTEDDQARVVQVLKNFPCRQQAPLDYRAAA